MGSYGNNAMYEELYNEETTKIAILGGGCSMDTIPTAQSSHLWNLIQVGYLGNGVNATLAIRIGFYTN